MMERYEGLKLVRQDIDYIISQLKKLESAVKPVFERRGIVFEVGVDLVETVVRGEVDLIVNAYCESSENLSGYDVAELVQKADPKYTGNVGVITGPYPYPVLSTLNLQFLEDMRDSLKEPSKI